MRRSLQGKMSKIIMPPLEHWKAFFDYYVQINPGDTRSPQPGVPDAHPKNRGIRGMYGLVDAEYRALMPTFVFIVSIKPAGRIQARWGWGWQFARRS